MVSETGRHLVGFVSGGNIDGEMRQNDLQLANESGRLMRKYADMVLVGLFGEV